MSIDDNDGDDDDDEDDAENNNGDNDKAHVCFTGTLYNAGCEVLCILYLILHFITEEKTCQPQKDLAGKN